MEITAFLASRVTEDEAFARGAMHLGCVERDDDPDDVIHGPLCAGRIAAECQSKRRLLEIHRIASGPSEYLDGSEVYGCNNCGWLSANDPQAYPDTMMEGPCDTLRALTVPYRQHPDYRKEWDL